MGIMNTSGSDRPARGHRPRPVSLAGARDRDRDALGAAGEPPPFTLRVIGRAIARRWWLILTLWLLGSAGLTSALYLKLKPSYEASSLLRIEPTQRDLFGNGLNATENFDSYLQTQVQLVLSSKVLTAALNHPEVRRVAGSEFVLRKVVQVQVVPRTFLIEVSMRAGTPTEAATVVNAVVDAYLDMAADWSDGANRTLITNLEAYHEKLRAQAAEKETAWLAVAEKGTVDPLAAASGATDGSTRSAKTSSAIEQYKHALEMLFKTKSELIEAEGLLKLRRVEAARAASTDRMKRQAETEGHSDPEYLVLNEQIQKAQLQLNEAQRLVRPGVSDPSVSRARKRLDTLVSQYQHLIARKERDVRDRQKGESSESTWDVREAEAHVEALEQSEARFQKLIDELEVASRREGGDAVRVAMIRESLTSVRDMQSNVLKRLEQLRFVVRGEPRISRLSAAAAVDQPVTDNRKKYSAAAPVALLFALLALFVVAEVRADRIGDPDEFAARGRVEVIGIVPPLPGPKPARGNRALLDYSTKLQELDQSLEHLRVALCRTHPEREGHCFLVTSAVGGEGKTNLAVQLAARCARAGESTLLIDADLRRTGIGQLLSLEQGPGLGEVLRGDVSLEDAMVAGLPGGFHLLPAGTLRDDPGRLLNGRGLELLLDRLRRSFAVILIDTPPILPVPDALILGRWCDAAILAVRHDDSRFPLVQRANRQLAAAGVHVAGAVVTGLRRSRFGAYAYAYPDNRPSDASTLPEIGPA